VGRGVVKRQCVASAGEAVQGSGGVGRGGGVGAGHQVSSIGQGGGVDQGGDAGAGWRRVALAGEAAGSGGSSRPRAAVVADWTEMAAVHM
jgi:hypothetical protein